MAPDRWQKIERIYHAVGARPLDERAPFLDQSCSGDPELRAEVERMLAVDAEAGDFLKASALELAARALAAAGPLHAGIRLGPYEILSPLGSGGMGEVYKARDTRLNRIVAIKVLPYLGGDDADRRKRFLREARAASALKHPNIVTIHDILSEGGRDALVMEYLEGPTLEERIGSQPLPLGEALHYAIQVADALAAAHATGIVHRDVKPGNIMLAGGGSDRGEVKVLDFGLAKMIGSLAPASVSESSSPGVIAGTVAYMSPEQAEGRSVDARSDIFSFGSVLYEMLTGQQPFRGTSQLATLASILRDPPAPLRSLRSRVPAELDVILRRCLEKDRNARYQSAAQLRQDLATCWARLDASAAAALHRPRKVMAALVLLVFLLAGIGWTSLLAYRYRWVHNVALPEIARLSAQEYSVAAFRLARNIDRYFPKEPQLAQLRRDIWVPVSIGTEPSGADVLIRDYAANREDWEALGRTPVLNLPLPAGNFCVKISKPGFAEVEGTLDAISRDLRRTLHPVGAAPPGMVFVPVDTFTVPSAGRVQSTAFWLDKYEVTNRHFKQFVDQGKYRRRDHWKQPFVDQGRQLSWEQAMARFVDSTAQPGPATWELGSFPVGHEDDPVAGVSWYEAAAYADFAGKSLPTVYHWAAAADFAHFSTILVFSNFQGDRPARVGSFAGVGRYGTYDMAGNVTEWCWNQSAGLRCVRGGAWSDPAYMYRTLDATSPFDRGPTRGMRCAQYAGTLPGPLTAPLADRQDHDYGKDKPVADAVFRAYRSIYAYDRGELRSRVESIDDTSPWWRRERVSFDAAYSDERVIAFVFLPRQAAPPYQTILFFPGGTALREHTSEHLELRRLDFLLRTGHAVVYPVYKGTYERSVSSAASGPNKVRDLRIQTAKDVSRSIDYIETRADLDHAKLAYFGASVGAGIGPIFAAVEPRLRTAILQGGGLGGLLGLPGEAQPLNFLPRVKIPVLMINGRNDFLSPFATSQVPMFRLLGTPENDKRHAVFDCGHSVPREEVIREVLAWLDRYLGPVQRKEP